MACPPLVSISILQCQVFMHHLSPRCVLLSAALLSLSLVTLLPFLFTWSTQHCPQTTPHPDHNEPGTLANYLLLTQLSLGSLVDKGWLWLGLPAHASFTLLLTPPIPLFASVPVLPPERSSVHSAAEVRYISHIIHVARLVPYISSEK